MPVVVFLIVVAPLWLILHYRSQRQTSKGLSANDQQRLDDLLRRTEQLRERIISLEQILDAQAPQWRQR
jgi:phage shock protein B